MGSKNKSFFLLLLSQKLKILKHSKTDQIFIWLAEWLPFPDHIYWFTRVCRQGLLHVSCPKKVYLGGSRRRAISMVAHFLWNIIPAEIRLTSPLIFFHKALNTLVLPMGLGNQEWGGAHHVSCLIDSCCQWVGGVIGFYCWYVRCFFL